MTYLIKEEVLAAIRNHRRSVIDFTGNDGRGLTKEDGVANGLIDAMDIVAALPSPEPTDDTPARIGISALAATLRAYRDTDFFGAAANFRDEVNQIAASASAFPPRQASPEPSRRWSEQLTDMLNDCEFTTNVCPDPGCNHVHYVVESPDVQKFIQSLSHQTPRLTHEKIDAVIVTRTATRKIELANQGTMSQSALGHYELGMMDLRDALLKESE